VQDKRVDARVDAVEGEAQIRMCSRAVVQ